MFTCSVPFMVSSSYKWHASTDILVAMIQPVFVQQTLFTSACLMNETCAFVCLLKCPECTGPGGS